MNALSLRLSTLMVLQLFIWGGRSSDVRSQFEVFCSGQGLTPRICAEVDDMALLPAVVVQDELRNGALQLYAEVPEIAERFYAVTLQRQFRLSILEELLG